MKRFICMIVVLCLTLSGACLAETSHAEDFLSNLSNTWNSFLGMAEDASQSIADWANKSGVADWVEGAVKDVGEWIEGSGLAEWADGALREIANWAEGVAGDIQTFVEENGPAIEAWLSQAGEDVQAAWETLTHQDGHTRQEIDQALDTVTESLEDAAKADGE